MPAASNPFFAKRRTPTEIKTELVSGFFGAWYDSVAPSLPKEPNHNLLLLDFLESIGQGRSELLLPAHGQVKQLGGFEKIKAFLQKPVTSGEGTAGAAMPDSTAPEAAATPADPQEDELILSFLANKVPAFACLNPLGNAGETLPLLTQLLESSIDCCLLFPVENLSAYFAKGKAGRAMGFFIGETVFAEVQAYFKKEKSRRKREDAFIAVLEKMMVGKGFLSLTFRVGFPDRDQTDQLLVYATKNKLVYSQVKALLLPYSDLQADGVPVFGANQHHQQQLLLFPELNRFSIRNLMQDLLSRANLFNYKPIDKIAEDHSPATPYIPENYQYAFELLRDQGKVLFINQKTLQPIKKAAPGSLVKFVLPKA